MTLFDLSGKTAIVTGGNGGIGLGMAEGLAGAGAAIVVAGRNDDKNAAAVAGLEQLGAQAIAVKVDVTQQDQVAALMSATTDRFGQLDILVNNAGTNIRHAPEDFPLDDWHTVMDINMTSAMLCCKAAYPHMVRAGGGKIINIGSMMSILASSYVAAYATSKGGIVQYTRVLASAWAKDNIQANSVLPGWIDTDMTRRARREVDGLHERVLARTPAGRWGAPADLAGVAVFLAGAASDFVTGAAIPVDGGFSMQA